MARKKERSMLQRYQELLAEADLKARAVAGAVKDNDAVGAIKYDYNYTTDNIEAKVKAGNGVWFTVATTTSPMSYLRTDSIITDNSVDWIIEPRTTAATEPADNIFNRVLDMDWED